MITTSLLKENFMIDSLSQFRQRLALQTDLLKKKKILKSLRFRYGYLNLVEITSSVTHASRDLSRSPRLLTL